MSQSISDFTGAAFLPVTVIGFSFFIGFRLLHEDQSAEQSLRLLSMG